MTKEGRTNRYFLDFDSDSSKKHKNEPKKGKSLQHSTQNLLDGATKKVFHPFV